MNADVKEETGEEFLSTGGRDKEMLKTFLKEA